MLGVSQTIVDRCGADFGQPHTPFESCAPNLPQTAVESHAMDLLEPQPTVESGGVALGQSQTSVESTGVDLSSIVALLEGSIRVSY